MGVQVGGGVGVKVAVGEGTRVQVGVGKGVGKAATAVKVPPTLFWIVALIAWLVAARSGVTVTARVTGTGVASTAITVGALVGWAATVAFTATATAVAKALLVAALSAVGDGFPWAVAVKVASGTVVVVAVTTAVAVGGALVPKPSRSPKKYPSKNMISALMVAVKITAVLVRIAFFPMTNYK